MLTAAKSKADATTAVPLVVDLDGTLIRSDLLVESLFGALAADPASAATLARAALEGRAALKDCAASLASIDVATLPYDADVLDLIEHARAEGRPVYLASASSAHFVEAVARHIGLFDGWFGSSGGINLKGTAKASRLVAEFGDGGFDYAGNDPADLAVWKRSRRAITVDLPERDSSELANAKPDRVALRQSSTPIYAWVKLLRVHQWAKNLLVFVPFAAAHAFHAGSAINAVMAFLAFSLCASGVYILNDVFDLAADRAHPTKKHRPLANGTVPILQAMALAPILIAAAFVIAFLTNGVFATILALYLVLTTAYTVYLKRKLLLDAVSLAALYTLRVIGGAAAIAVPVSRWLLAFSLFIFTAMALIKRYVELARLLDRGLPNPVNRAYEKGDLPIVASLAAAAGYNAVIVLALYVSSDAVAGLYRSPELLWLVCPLMMYWISRLLMKAHRRQMDDDPVVFALKDPLSLGIAFAIAALGYVAI